MTVALDLDPNRFEAFHTIRSLPACPYRHMQGATGGAAHAPHLSASGGPKQ
jgi:hypothetical protein